MIDAINTFLFVGRNELITLGRRYVRDGWASTILIRLIVLIVLT